MKSLLKGVVNAAALAVVWPAGLLCWLEKRTGPGHEGVFQF